MSIKPSTLALGGLAAVGLFLLFHKPKVRFAGDLAQVGDLALIPVASQLPGALPAAIPGTAASFVVQVQSTEPENLIGFIMAYVMPDSPTVQHALPTPAGPVTVPKVNVAKVYRKGTEVTA
jgi:hypothetical protein